MTRSQLQHVRRHRGALGLLAASLLAVAACSAPGEDADEEVSADTEDQITAPVTPDDVAELGDITLRVWADAGEKATLKDYVPTFEETYPNVDVEVTEKGFDDLMKTVVNAMSSDNPPDVTQGNQGYAVDGTLVKAGLIRPLDDVAEAYGWTDTVPAGALASMRWDESGTTFGDGDLYGISPVTQNVVLFYNQKLLDQAGLDVPTTFAEFEAALPVLAGEGIQPIMLGNADTYPAVNILGAVAGAFVPPEETNDWVYGRSDSTIVSDGYRQAVETMVNWAGEGYFGEGFNGLSADDAAARFAQGEGAFLVAGDWNVQTVAEGAGKSGITAFPAGASGQLVSTGSLGLGWHISSQTENLPAAAAFIAGLHEPEYAQALAEQGRVPVMSDDAQTSTQLLNDDITAAGELLADDGQTGFLDWASDTMYDESGARMQELLAGRIDADQFLTALQENWQSYQDGR